MKLQVKATQEGTTVLWIPNRFGVPKISGNNIISSETQKVDGGYLACVKVNHDYSISINF